MEKNYNRQNDSFKNGKKFAEENENYTTPEGEATYEDVEVVDPSNIEELDAALDQEDSEEKIVDGIVDKEVRLQADLDSIREELDKEKKEYLFLMAEFDNFRKRSMKEKSELIKNAAEQALKGLLPIVDDFERGLKASENVDDANSIREGMVIIYNKLKKYLEQNGVKEFDPADNVFDPDKHEAISAVPVPDDNMKGKILDTVEKGYTINGKVLRHAKVVVGQ